MLHCRQYKDVLRGVQGYIQSSVTALLNIQGELSRNHSSLYETLLPLYLELCGSENTLVKISW